MTHWFFLSTIVPMLKSCLVFFSITCCVFSAEALSSQQSFIEQFQSSRLLIPAEDSYLLADSPGRYPAPLRFFLSRILGWTPLGEGKLLSTKCDSYIWSDRLKDPRLVQAPQLQGALVQKYFQECREEVETGVKNSWINSKDMMTISYDPHAHPFMRRVFVGLPGNVKLKGLLALKGDMKRRPIVIVRTGIFSSVEDFIPERAWMMMLFEQSPFNVLFLENMSSADFINNNNQFAFGGYDEGLQNILVAKLLQDSNEPISRIVESVHLFGVSLGGHGVLFASLLNRYNSSKQHPLIQSFTALCPVVHLKPTMEALTQDGVKSAFVDFWSRRRLKGLDEKLPNIKTHESFSFLSTAIAEVARSYQGGLSHISSIHLPPGMKDGPHFWELNDFWQYYKDVDEPVLIYATRQDPAVPYALNSQLIVQKKMNIESKNIRIIELAEGVHCTLPVAYDWRALTSVFQSYILSHSADFKMSEQSLNVDLSDNEWKNYFGEGSQVNFKVDKPDEDAKFVKVELHITNKDGDDKTIGLSLPLSQFDFRFLNSQLSQSEKEMIVRWVNQNLRASLVSAQNRNILKLTWPVAM